MAYTNLSVAPPIENSSPASSISDPWRSSCHKYEGPVAEDEVVQGRILWLPPKAELPVKAVRRAHGKGAVEEGIYDHPIVVISRPTEDPSIVHFHLITSFQGKRLHEIYGKANEFHTSRRSWYLPIAPAPEHPDAKSKKAKKRFPTLRLADGLCLRWDSYVNLRHVYKVKWAYLRPYNNPDAPWSTRHRFERESFIRMLAKGRVLTTYETGHQHQTCEPRPNRTGALRTEDWSPTLRPIAIDPMHEGKRGRSQKESDESDFDSEIEPIKAPEGSGQASPRPSDFQSSFQAKNGSTLPPPKAPPDGGSGQSKLKLLWCRLRCILKRPWEMALELWARLSRLKC